MNPERQRLRDDAAGPGGFQHWGPYLAERQWGTVREDYSADGNAWDYFPFEHAHSRAYRWGEDGLAGFSDAEQRVCLSLALWNGRDALLKERLFGLTNAQGNHGEDVKEVYYYLDATPSHSYLKMLYKYPQAAFPYEALIGENARRGLTDPEFELWDTGVFDGGRYFDVFVEYAQGEPGDILMRVTAVNRGPEAAVLHVIPQLTLRNTWSWDHGVVRPSLIALGADHLGIEAHARGAVRRLYAEAGAQLLFTDNESNAPRLWGAQPKRGAANGAPASNGGYYKDGLHERIVRGREDAVNPEGVGTKAGVWHSGTLAAGATAVYRLRLTRNDLVHPFADFDALFDERRAEADAFYAELQAGLACADARAVQRQAFAGLIWSKQFYHYDVARWLDGDPKQPPPPPARLHGRNAEWRSLNNADVISMPDTWEYPWYAAWDLAFHCIPFALIDPAFAKRQLVLLTREWYMHPNAQLPAYEWAFGDSNPPVHAWAAWRVYQIDRKHHGGRGDREFLERVFHKLMMNFTWWVNRKDVAGRNVFQGGFLGLDNIGVFDRSQRLPGEVALDQTDATSWMAMYCLNLMRIALELALEDPVYQDIASKFFEHFLAIAEAIEGDGHAGPGLWDEEEQFFFDVLHVPDGAPMRLKVRSLVGLLPLLAIEVLEPELLERLPEFARRLEWLLAHRPTLAARVSHWHVPGHGERRLLALLRSHRLVMVLKRMLDETEFLSAHGVRSLSRAHRDAPYEFKFAGQTFTVRYTPAESESRAFGGNSNWRGPVWFPLNYLIIESLQKAHYYYGDGFKVECPTGSGRQLNLGEVAAELGRRLARLFLADETGRRPVLAAMPALAGDPHCRDHLLFYEYFDSDSGRGVGASHQTGWTALIAKLLMPRA